MIGHASTALLARLLTLGASELGVAARVRSVAVEVRWRNGQLVEYRAIEVM